MGKLSAELVVTTVGQIMKFGSALLLLVAALLCATPSLSASADESSAMDFSVASADFDNFETESLDINHDAATNEEPLSEFETPIEDAEASVDDGDDEEEATFESEHSDEERETLEDDDS